MLRKTERGRNMILADKIIELRKKNGWSQEELAEKVDVTRQSVSKWEGAQSVPDLDKILKLSQIFGVSTDYLLKDTMEEEEYTQEEEPEWQGVRRVSMEEANDFLAVKEQTSGHIAYAAFACIISPICLLLLGAASEAAYGITENQAAGIGLTVLVILIAAASAVFISCGMKTKRFEYLEKEIIETEYGVSGMVRECQRQYRPVYVKNNIIGTVLCILSIVPLFAVQVFTEEDFILVITLCVTIAMAGIGSIFFIIGGIRWVSLEKLLQEGDYSRQRKSSTFPTGTISAVYWLVAAAIYLALSLPADQWKEYVMFWPVAGVLFAAVMVICSAIEQRGRRKH